MSKLQKLHLSVKHSIKKKVKTSLVYNVDGISVLLVAYLGWKPYTILHVCWVGILVKNPREVEFKLEQNKAESLQIQLYDEFNI